MLAWIDQRNWSMQFQNRVQTEYVFLISRTVSKVTSRVSQVSSHDHLEWNQTPLQTTTQIHASHLQHNYSSLILFSVLLNFTNQLKHTTCCNSEIEICLCLLHSNFCSIIAADIIDWSLRLYTQLNTSNSWVVRVFISTFMILAGSDKQSSLRRM